jgi:hypothetical protein
MKKEKSQIMDNLIPTNQLEGDGVCREKRKT